MIKPIGIWRSLLDGQELLHRVYEPPPIPATTRFPTRAARLRPAPGALPVRCPPSPRAPGEPRPHARFQERLWDLAPAAR